MTCVNEFEGTLVERLHVTALPSDLVNEGDLERRFLLPIVRGDLVVGTPGDSFALEAKLLRRGQCFPMPPSRRCRRPLRGRGY